MKRILLSVFIAGLMASVASCQGEAGQGTTAPALSKTEFQEKLSALPDAQLVDVRTPEEFGEGHLEGAVNIDFLDADAFASGIEGLDKNKPVLLYCRSGRRSAEAGKLLFQEGFKEVCDLKGGYLEWNKE